MAVFDLLVSVNPLIASYRKAFLRFTTTMIDSKRINENQGEPNIIASRHSIQDLFTKFGFHWTSQRRRHTVPKAARDGGHGQYSVSIFGVSSARGAWAAGNLEDLMMSSADLLWAARAAESESVFWGN